MYLFRKYLRLNGQGKKHFGTKTLGTDMTKLIISEHLGDKLEINLLHLLCMRTRYLEAAKHRGNQELEQGKDESLYEACYCI